MKWIKTSIEKTAEEKEESWTKTWNEYIDKLVRQNSERSKLVPQACKLAYLYANREGVKASDLPNGAEIVAALTEEGLDAAEADKLVTDWFKKEGGLCNDGKAHL